MPLISDITTMSVTVAITTPRRVRNERSLCARKASMAIQKASRTVTQTPERTLERAASARGREAVWPNDARITPVFDFGIPICGGSEGGRGRVLYSRSAFHPPERYSRQPPNATAGRNCCGGRKRGKGAAHGMPWAKFRTDNQIA